MRITFSDNNAENLRPGIFIDRDGVINRRIVGGYVLHWSDFSFVPGIRESLKDLADLKLPLIVVSNQAAVGRGLLQVSELESITARMYSALLEKGAPLTAVYYCIHSPEQKCICRKPSPVMLERAAADYSIDLSRSVFIGDSESDTQAARSAGCHPIRFRGTAPGGDDCIEPSNEVPKVSTASELFAVVARCLHAAGQTPINSTIR